MFDHIGVGLERPECTLANASGCVFCCDSRGGIVRTDNDGTQHYLGEQNTIRFRPNGIALLADGSLLFANQRAEGGIWSISPDNHVSPYLLEIEGEQIGAVNFVLVAPDGSVWFSVLSRAGHNAPLSASRADGYVARIQNGQAKIMIDDLVSANEFRFNVSRSEFYINETFARRTTMFDIDSYGELVNRRLLAVYDTGNFVNGVTLDADGNLWITCIISNRILLVTRDGVVHTVYDESDPARIETAENALRASKLTRSP